VSVRSGIRLVLLLLVSHVVPAQAEPTAPTRLAETLLAQAASAVGSLDPGRADIGVAVRADLEAPGREALATTVADLLVGRLALTHPAWRSVQAVAGGDAARLAGVDLLLEVSLRRSGARLLADGSLRRTDPGFWEAALGRRTGLLGHLYADVAVDRSVRDLLGRRVEAGGFVAVRVERPPGVVAASHAVDLDGDGRAELAVAASQRVGVWTLSRGRFVARATLDLLGLPRAPQVSRAPIAALAARPGADGPAPRLLVWTGRLARPVWVAVGPVGLRLLDEALPPGVPLAVRPRAWLLGEPLPGRAELRPRGWWTPGSPPGEAEGQPVLGAIAWPDGGAWLLPGGRLQAEDGRMWTGVGAGAVACDLDADGTPELVVSSDALPDAPDLLRMLGPTAGVHPRWRAPYGR